MAIFDLEKHRKSVAKALRDLEKAITQLIAVLAHRPIWIEIEDASTTAIAVQMACAAYAAIDYGMKDAVGSSMVCLGAIGAIPEALRRAEAVNTAKLALKAVCAPLQQIRMRVPGWN